MCESKTCSTQWSAVTALYECKMQLPLLLETLVYWTLYAPYRQAAWLVCECWASRSWHTFSFLWCLWTRCPAFTALFIRPCKGPFNIGFYLRCYVWLVHCERSAAAATKVSFFRVDFHFLPFLAFAPKLDLRSAMVLVLFVHFLSTFLSNNLPTFAQSKCLSCFLYHLKFALNKIRKLLILKFSP